LVHRPWHAQVLHRQGSLMDALRVVLRGSGACLYRDPTANTRCVGGALGFRPRSLHQL
jgi:hypothetical protein